jgi:hypothetical protein
MRAVFAALAALALAGPAAAHRMNAATSVIEERPAGQLQITHRIYAHDLEHALDLPAVAADYFDSPEGQRLLGRYVADRFLVARPDGRPLPLRYVGAETERDLVLVYFEGRLPQGLRGLKIDSDILMDLNPDQANLVNLRAGGTQLSLRFTAGTGPRDAPFPRPTR